MSNGYIPLKAYVTHAYCPHVGANVAVGGKVVGDCVECPFHKWSFNGESGQCTNIPYLQNGKVSSLQAHQFLTKAYLCINAGILQMKEIPEFIKLKTYTSKEVNGLIFLWYHADGEEPNWEVEPVPNLVDGVEDQWIYQGRSEFEV